MANRIVSDPRILGGKPVIKGTRISVELILELFAAGGNYQDILDAYPHLRFEDVQAAMRYAAQFMKNEMVMELQDTAP